MSDKTVTAEQARDALRVAIGARARLASFTDETYAEQRAIDLETIRATFVTFRRFIDQHSQPAGMDEAVEKAE